MTSLPISAPAEQAPWPPPHPSDARFPQPRLAWRSYGFRIIERPECTARGCRSRSYDMDIERTGPCDVAEHIGWRVILERRDGEDALGAERWLPTDALPAYAVAELIEQVRAVGALALKDVR